VSTLRAFLVGIDQYVAVTPLHGCVRDIRAVEALLRDRVGAGALSVEVLLDGEATREAIVAGFRQHLAKAEPGDVALFYYCGHGSQEPCPAEWAAVEPSGRNQTLVSVDARVGEVFDLADKEVNALLHEVARSGAAVFTIFDSCHSGGMTREAGDAGRLGEDAGVPRMTAASRSRPRTLDDYLPEARALYAPERLAREGVPAVRHLAIAACQPSETAKEFPRTPPRRGAFTQALEESLSMLGPTATCAEVVNTIRVKVRHRASDQVPNLHAAGGADGASLFLGGQLGPRALLATADDAGTWWLAAGVVDGIADPSTGDVTEVTLSPRAASAATRASLPDDAPAPVPAARALVAAAHEDRSRLQLTAGTIDAGLAYEATIVRMARAPLRLHLAEGSGGDVGERVRGLLAAPAAQYVLVDRVEEASLRLVVHAAQVDLCRLDGRSIGLRFPVDDRGLRGLLACCEHLGRWCGLRERRPVDSSLNDAVRPVLYQVPPGQKVPPAGATPVEEAGGVVRLAYSEGKPPRVQVRLRNTSEHRLYVALLTLSEAFASTPWFADWIGPGDEVMVQGGKSAALSIPAWLGPDASETSDLFKVLAAKGDFDASRLELPPLLGTAASTRAVTFEEEEDGSFWGTTEVRVVVTRVPT